MPSCFSMHGLSRGIVFRTLPNVIIEHRWSAISQHKAYFIRTYPTQTLEHLNNVSFGRLCHLCSLFYSLYTLPPSGWPHVSAQHMTIRAYIYCIICIYMYVRAHSTSSLIRALAIKFWLTCFGLSLSIIRHKNILIILFCNQV